MTQLSFFNTDLNYNLLVLKDKRIYLDIIGSSIEEVMYWVKRNIEADKYKLDDLDGIWTKLPEDSKYEVAKLFKLKELENV